MRLLHFISEEDWERSKREGEIASAAEKNRRDGFESYWSEDEPFYLFADELVWLTTNRDADRQDSWTTCRSETPIRVTVEISAVAWLEHVRTTYPDYQQEVDDERNWYVCDQPIPRSRWLHAEDAYTGERLPLA